MLGKVTKLAATTTIRPGDGTVTRVTKVSNLIGYFSPDAVITYDVTGWALRSVSGRDEIREIAAGGFANVASLSVRFQDATARVAADQQSAIVSCTVRVSAGDSKDFGIQELRLQFRKIDGDWLITRVETVKTLQ